MHSSHKGVVMKYIILSILFSIITICGAKLPEESSFSFRSSLNGEKYHVYIATVHLATEFNNGPLYTGNQCPPCFPKDLCEVSKDAVIQTLYDLKRQIPATLMQKNSAPSFKIISSIQKTSNSINPLYTIEIIGNKDQDDVYHHSVERVSFTSDSDSASKCLNDLICSQYAFIQREVDCESSGVQVEENELYSIHERNKKFFFKFDKGIHDSFLAKSNEEVCSTGTEGRCAKANYPKESITFAHTVLKKISVYMSQCSKNVAEYDSIHLPYRHPIHGNRLLSSRARLPQEPFGIHEEFPKGHYVTFVAAPEADYKVALMSDPQPWRLNNDNDPNSANSRDEWETVNSRIVTSLNKLNSRLKFRFGIFNGDMTEFGRQTTRDSFYRVYGHLNFPFYKGLGNHDYANNVNDCWEATIDDLISGPNGCARHSFLEMWNRIVEYSSQLENTSEHFNVTLLPNLQCIQNPRCVPPFFTMYRGSLAYSWDEGVLHFVQLHNYPTYEVYLGAQMDGPSGGVSVESALSWLENDLKEAKSRGKQIVLNYHDPSEHFFKQTSNADRDRYRAMLEKYKVLAVFAGHYHHAFHFVHHDDPFYGDVPVFVTDAIYQGGFFVLNVKEHSISVDSYNCSTPTEEPVLLQSWADIPFQ